MENPIDPDSRARWPLTIPPRPATLLGQGSPEAGSGFCCLLQTRIEDTLKTLSRRIEKEKGDVAKSLSLKKALMDDLLTGRVRVPLPTEATP